MWKFTRESAKSKWQDFRKSRPRQSAPAAKSLEFMTAHNHKRRERRAHPRHAVDLAVKILVGDRAVPLCRIRDLCPGGALVQCGGKTFPATLASGQPCDMLLKLPLQDGERELRLGGEVVRLLDGGFGARFTAVDPEALTVLHAFLAELGDSSAANLAPDGRVRGVLEPHLDGLVAGVIEYVESELQTYREQAKSDAARGRITADLSQILWAHRQGNLELSLRQNLLGKSASPTVAAYAATFDKVSLEIVDKDRFEIWLAKSALVKSLEDALAPSLEPLRRALGGVSVPLDPKDLAEGLDATFDLLGLSTEVRVLGLRAAGQVLPHLLEPLYRDLIETLPPPAPAPLQRPELEHTAPTTGEVGAPKALTPGEVADALMTLPAGTLWEGGAVPIEQLLGLITAPGASLPPQVAERIEFSDRMLTGMLEQGSVPLAGKRWIGRLGQRLLAAAVAEPGFFVGDHPLLRLVDQVEHLAMLLGDDARGITLGREIDALLERAMETDGRDRNALKNITDRLAVLEHLYGEQYRRNVDRVVAACEGRQRLREAQREVRRRINQWLAGRRMHRAVADLLDGAWRSLLQLVCLREGEHSPEFRDRWKTLLDLHVACGGELSGYTLACDRSTLPAAVRKGLAYVGFDPFRRAILFDRLQTALRTVLPGAPAPDADYLKYPMLPAPADDQPMSNAPAEGTDPKRWSEILEQVKRLAVGASLRMEDGEQSQRLRLAWRSRDGDELVLINPRGFRVRSFSPVELGRILLEGTGQVVDAEEQGLSSRTGYAFLENMRSRIVHHATRDRVTGLSNRGQLLGTLTRRLSEETRGLPQLLGFVDLDQLDIINSTCGYFAGEKLLADFAERLERTLAEGAFLAYLGGSRFGFALSAADEAEAEAEAVGERVRATVAEHPFQWEGAQFAVSSSLGLVVGEPRSDTAETLLSSADTACLAARRTGGNRVVVFREDDEEILRQRDQMRWLVSAESAVKAGRLRLRCQRIAPAVAGSARPHHYEILASAFDEQGEPLALGPFISAAEAFNLMAEVDRMVIGKTLDWLQAYPDHWGLLGSTAINLSGQSMGDKGLVEFIRISLSERKIPPKLVSFEVTETAAIINLDAAAAIIQGIKDLGCRFALDDFGTGMSSYSYLKRLPVDYLKIDGSFVKDMLNNPNDQAIVKSINEIAHFMGMETIAEYVENQAIAERLRSIGVDYLQGYAVEKPLYLDDVGQT